MSKQQIPDLGRRRFLVGGTAVVGAAAGAAVLPKTGQGANYKTGIAYPSRRLANLKELQVNEPIAILYPDEASPGLLVRMGHPVEGGVGPNRDVVAFSILCPHKGSPLSYNKADRSLTCPLHFSRFDPEMGGQAIFGSTNQNLPQFSLRVDAKGDVFAEGVDELIFGRTANVLA